MKFEKPAFLNPSSAPPKTKRGSPVPWDIALLVFAFAAIVIVSALAFYWGSSRGWGIQSTFQTAGAANLETEITFWDSLHFSVVTIATLGYGDYRPVSYGRLVAGVEVVGGIILMGVLISRLVSRQQDRLTRRLITGQLNNEIQNFREMLGELLVAYGAISHPASTLPSALLDKTDGLSKSIARYWRFQSKMPDFALIVPLKAAGRMLGEASELLESIEKLVIAKKPADIGESNRTNIRNITESFLAVAGILETKLAEPGIEHSAAKIYGQVTQLREQLQLKLLCLKK